MCEGLASPYQIEYVIIIHVQFYNSIKIRIVKDQGSNQVILTVLGICARNVMYQWIKLSHVLGVIWLFVQNVQRLVTSCMSV